MRIDSIDRKRNFGLIGIPETPQNAVKSSFIKDIMKEYKISGSWVGKDAETGKNVLLLMTEDGTKTEKKAFKKLKNFFSGIFTASKEKYKKLVEEQQKHQAALDVYSTEQAFIDSVSKARNK